MPDPDAASPTPPLLRQALGRFATGVTIVTCRTAEGTAIGLTANSFSGVSLEPPLVLWSLRLASPNLQIFTDAVHFTVNVLSASQVHLSRRFASAAPDKFTAGAWSDGAQGAPVLADCAAVFECETLSHQELGDHRLFVGRVLRATESGLAPLVFQAGHYHVLGERR